MSRPRYSINRKKYLLEDEYEKLHKRLESLYTSEPRDSTLIFTALYTGARAQEVLNIRPDDLDTRDQTVFIRGLKGSNDREIPVPSWLFKRLQHLAEGKHIFPICYQRLFQIWESYRPVRKKFHALRHTFAIRQFERTRDIRLIQLALGHRNIQNTMVYVDYVYSTKEMKRLLVG